MLSGLLLIASATVLSGCAQKPVFDVRLGDCFDDDPSEDWEDTVDVYTVEALDCDDPHDNEVYAVISYDSADEYSDEETMSDDAVSLCIECFEGFVGLDYEESDLGVGALWPTAGSWSDGDRQIQCFLYAVDASKLIGTAQGTAR